MDDQKTEKRLILQVLEASEKCSKRIYSTVKLYVGNIYRTFIGEWQDNIVTRCIAM